MSLIFGETLGSIPALLTQQFSPYGVLRLKRSHVKIPNLNLAHKADDHSPSSPRHHEPTGLFQT